MMQHSGRDMQMMRKESALFNTKNIMRVLYENVLLFGNVYYDVDIKQHQHYKILYDYFTAGELNGFCTEEGQVSNAVACGYLHKHRSFRSEQEIIMCKQLH